MQEECDVQSWRSFCSSCYSATRCCSSLWTCISWRVPAENHAKRPSNKSSLHTLRSRWNIMWSFSSMGEGLNFVKENESAPKHLFCKGLGYSSWNCTYRMGRDYAKLLHRTSAFKPLWLRDTLNLNSQVKSWCMTDSIIGGVWSRGSVGFRANFILWLICVVFDIFECFVHT